MAGGALWGCGGGPLTWNSVVLRMWRPSGLQQEATSPAEPSSIRQCHSGCSSDHTWSRRDEATSQSGGALSLNPLQSQDPGSCPTLSPGPVPTLGQGEVLVKALKHSLPQSFWKPHPHPPCCRLWSASGNISTQGGEGGGGGGVNGENSKPRGHLQNLQQ